MWWMFWYLYWSSTTTISIAAGKETDETKKKAAGVRAASVSYLRLVTDRGERVI
jgi:hypothetical protein